MFPSRQVCITLTFAGKKDEPVEFHAVAIPDEFKEPLLELDKQLLTDVGYIDLNESLFRLDKKNVLVRTTMARVINDLSKTKVKILRKSTGAFPPYTNS